MTDAPAIPVCPLCGNPAERAMTRYGIRDACHGCALWSWGGKALVSAKIHEARKHCHNVVDALWKRAHAIYDITEAPGSEAHEKACRRIGRAARGRTYAYIAAQLQLTEPEVHMSDQDNIGILRMIYAEALKASPVLIRAWAKARQPEEIKNAKSN